MRPELAAAHAAVGDAVVILRDGRNRPHARIDKAAKDFLTEVDLASEAALQQSLAVSTPDIGFFGEETGGAPLESGRVWVADPLDGTINYATGSPLCGVMLGLVEDGVPTLGVIDLRDNAARMVTLSGRDAIGTWNQLEILMTQWRQIQSFLDQPGPPG